MATAWTGGAERFRAAFGTRQMTKTPTGDPARRTSETHPLQIASLPIRDGYGRIGITLCPGKQQAHASTGAWSRDLGLDLDAIAAWNTAAVVTLVEAHELERLKVPELGAAVQDRHLGWYHLPIRDGGIPDAAFEERWAQIGPGLRAMLRDGSSVVLHCIGGLGRAGTIAARLLIELGAGHDAAVSQVRAARPGAIETSAQLQHVMAITPVDEVPPDTAPEAARDRAVGALLGLCVGDAVGTTAEFKPRGSFPRLTDMVGGGPFRLTAGQWTDDSAMAIALATCLIDNGRLDAADLMTRFVAWMEQGEYSCTATCFDIGVTVSQALRAFKRTGNPLSGSTDPHSAGNGSLMRLAPVAIRYWQDRSALKEAAALQSRTTHGAPEAVDACVAYADVLADAIAGLPRDIVLRPHSESYAGAIAPIMAGSWRGKHGHAVQSSGYVAHSLEASLWCIGRTSSFEEAVLLAANLGGDSDTTAAITGQLAGALYGKKGIPERWLKRLAWCDLIESLALELTTPFGWYPE